MYKLRFFNKSLIPTYLEILKNPNSTCSSTKNIYKLNYKEECEQKINNQINLELYASYVYLTMAYYFNQSSVSLDGFKKLFLQFSEEEMQHARTLMNYQNLRGGKLIYYDIKAPDVEWTLNTSVQTSIDLEKQVTQCLLELHQTANKHCDPNLTSFLESAFLEEQYISIKHLYNLQTKLKRVGDQEGLHILDKELGKISKFVLKESKNK